MIPGAACIGWASRFVLFMRRRAWRREWEAEVAHAWQRLNRNGQPSAWSVLRLRIRIYTCVIDALWERKQTMKMTGPLNDVRHAVRNLLRHRAFTTIAVTTLALGIGANTAVFTLVDGVLISPLAFDDPEQLIAIQHIGHGGPEARQLPMSQGLYNVYREHASTIESIALFAGTTVNLIGDGDAQRIRGQAVTPGCFAVLGVEAAMGRTFLEEEGAPEGERVIILSDGFWRNDLGADPAVLGTSLDINGILRRVVGVMPAEFGHPNQDARLWAPLIVDPARASLANFGADGIARVGPGNSVQSAATEIEGLIGRLPELFPESGAVSFLQEVGLESSVLPLKQSLVGDVTATLWILLGTVGFVLLIACANVANLLLVRAEGRQRELALRVAVGAGRWQVLRSFLSESVVLAGVGGFLGMVIAGLAVKASLSLVLTAIPRVAEIGVDLRVMSFTAVIALGCAVFFGFFPMLRYGADDLASQLREGGARGATGGKESHLLRNGLVVVQMALALVVLVGSGLMYRSFQALRSVDAGFDTEQILTAHITVPTAEVQDWGEVAGFFRQLSERLEAQPGIESVGFGQSVPLGNGLGYFSIDVEDHPRPEGELPVFARNHQVEVGFIETLGIDVLDGRAFQDGDGAEGARSVLVTESFAQHWWPGQSALGRRMRLGYEGEDWYNIVGVVADAHYQSLEQTPEEMVYWPATVGPAEDPQPTRGMDVAIKTD
jgi:predicted permease